MSADRPMIQPTDDQLSRMLRTRAERSPRIELVSGIVAAARATPQRRRWTAWPGWPAQNSRLAFAALIGATTVLAVAAIFLGSRPSVTPPPPTPNPTTGASPTAVATTPPPTPTPQAWPAREPGWRRAAQIPGLLNHGMNVPLIAGVRDEQVWMRAYTDKDGPERNTLRVHSYDLRTDSWRDMGPTLDHEEGGENFLVLAVETEGDFLALGHRQRERIAIALDRVTLRPVISDVQALSSAFIYPRHAVRAPDGRLFLLEAFGRQISTPVTLVTYDPVRDEWTEPPALSRDWRVRPLLAVDATGGVYVIGGYSVFMSTPSVIRLDPVTGEWSAQPELPPDLMAGADRFGSAAAFDSEGRLYVFGYMTESLQPAFYRLDPGAGAWTELDGRAMPIEPHDAILAPDGSIMVVGHEGAKGSEGPPAVWLYTPGD